jgi:hypothetical protein
VDQEKVFPGRAESRRDVLLLTGVAMLIDLSGLRFFGGAQKLCNLTIEKGI